MSTIMQQGLASLLVRRTEAGRARALRCIQAWKHAISAVRKAESMAECRINLPDEQIQGMQQALGEVDTANYVLAVHLANQATIKREAVQTTAIKVLQEETKHCDNEQSDATHSIQTAMRKRDDSLNEAKKNREYTISSMPKYKKASDSVTDWMTTNLGVIVWVLLACVIALVFGSAITDNEIFRPLLILALLLPSLGGVGSFFNWLYRARVEAYMAGVESKRSSHIAVADATFEKTAKTIEMQLQEEKDVIENRISQAEVHKKRIENALQWLQAEFVQHD